MKKLNCSTRFLALAAFALAVPLISGPANAQDDGARTYWKGRAGTNADVIPVPEHEFASL